MSTSLDRGIADGNWVPPCPPIEPIRGAAREVDYAIGLHGSLDRDFDLIAVPWTDEAVDADLFIEHLCRRFEEKTGFALFWPPHIKPKFERKPHGRVGIILQVEGWFKHIDLSIMPCSPKKGEAMSRLALLYGLCALPVLVMAAYRRNRSNP